jgi:hypothetical protein
MVAHSWYSDTVGEVKLNGRQIAILAILVLFGILAVAPVVLVNNSSSSSGDVGYQALKIYSRSQLGDRSADADAIEIYPTLLRRSENGRETFSRLGIEGVCWELDLSKSSEPYKTDLNRCEKE